MPTVPELLSLGSQSQQSGDLPRAEQLYREAVRLEPESAPAHNRLGVLLARRGNVEEASAHFARAVQLRPDFADAQNNLGITLKVQGKEEEALTAYRRAIDLNPNVPGTHSNLGLLLADQGRYDKALACYEQALRIAPDFAEARKNRALVWLVQGRFDQGLREYEWRFRCPDLPERTFSRPRWDGTAGAGRTILLHAEQGLGDTLQFCRYAALVLARGFTVLLEVQPPLVPLLAGLAGADAVLPRGTPLFPFDVHAPLLSLPALLGTTLATVPAAVPYLRADPARIERWRKILAGPGLKIGVAWQGNREYPGDRQRSIPLAAFAPLARLPGVRLISLQKGAGTEQRSALPADCRVEDLGPDLDADGAFLDTAAVMACLDRVVTSDTAAAHLAGALGVPVWLALPFAPDWRWLLDRDDCPWYPTMRLFRQSRPGDWGGVFERIADALRPQSAPRGAVRLEPNKAWALNSQGVVLARQSDLAGAAARFAEAVRLEPGFADAHYNLGLALKELGRNEESLASYRRAVELRPDFANAHNNLVQLLLDLRRPEEASAAAEQAVRSLPHSADAHLNVAAVRLAQGRSEEAVAACREALRLKPDFAAAHNNLGAALSRLGNLDEAADSYRAAIRCLPDFAEAHNNLGWVLARQKKWSEGAEACRTAVRLAPAFAPAHCNLGNVLHSLEKPDEAAACYREAIRLQPDHADAHSNLGLVLKELAKLDEAAESCRTALRLKPDFAEAHNNLGLILAEQGKLEEAVACYSRAVELKPEFAEAYTNLGTLLGKLDRIDEALAACRKAVDLKPDFLEGHFNLGTALRQHGRLTEAAACYDAALRLNPEHIEARFNRALVWLRQGDWVRGWTEYQCRRRRPELARSFVQPRWDGTVGAGRTILLHAEQGLGDTLQFCRYADLVLARGFTVLLEVQPPLVPLLAGLAGADAVLPRGAALPPFDVHAPLLSLPALLCTTLATVPANVPYLRADPARVERWRKVLAGPGLKIGVAWQGNREYSGDRQRSIPLTAFAPLARLPGVRLISLQKGAGTEQRSALPADCRVEDLGPDLDADGAFLDTAAVMACLDRVVTSDTAAAHLAGALGVPVWLALPFAPDWRWLLDRDDCPWYPTMRLFRQSRPGDWSGVFERIADALRPRSAAVVVEVSPGELLDKISILEIKSQKITAVDKLANVRRELAALTAARDRALSPSPETTHLAAELKAVNEALWRTEDDIRACERDGDFGPRFIALARSVYRDNDRRAALKRRINDLLGACLVEEKSYTTYGP